MNPLFILTIFITISVSLSKPSDGNGFSVDLIHIDSPLSPLYNTSHSLTDRNQNAFRRDMSSMSRLSKLDPDVFTTREGEYIMKIRVGTPPVEVFGIIDTFSDNVWVQCAPTEKSCHKKTASPFFVPASSSTYERQTCRSKACGALQDFKLPCNAQDICVYDTRVNSCSKGELGMDTFWLGTTRLDRVLFACDHNVRSLGDNVISANIGISGGSLSLFSQLNTEIKGKFSYCQMPQTKDASNQTIKLHFGDDADVSGANVVSTPIIKKSPKSIRYVNLYDVLAGNVSSQDQNGGTRSRRLVGDVEHGNMFIDMSSRMTSIPAQMYISFSVHLAEAIGGPTVADPTRTYNSICYKDLNVTRVPVVTFRFDYADIKVEPRNVFMEVGQGVSCLPITYTDDKVGVFGNLYQRNLLVGFDLVKQKVSFKPTDCGLYN